MKLQHRIDRLEWALAARLPAHDAAATFAALAETLDRMAARKVEGCATVQRELAALVASLEGGNAARAT